ncbi:hypothetical protein BJY16_008224 [Actinoplanes octamycinicus]|uniref:Uncharacterized protein n=1 Tax=Actinoplanes octamycinicus TaxID=135948 RepID=A0A7W7MCF0_9ACTN|nr:hypothetical protein [Actinoplanes octamycinicus]
MALWMAGGLVVGARGGRRPWWVTSRRTADGRCGWERSTPGVRRRRSRWAPRNRGPCGRKPRNRPAWRCEPPKRRPQDGREPLNGRARDGRDPRDGRARDGRQPRDGRARDGREPRNGRAQDRREPPNGRGRGVPARVGTGRGPRGWGARRAGRPGCGPGWPASGSGRTGKGVSGASGRSGTTAWSSGRVAGCCGCGLGRPPGSWRLPAGRRCGPGGWARVVGWAGLGRGVGMRAAAPCVGSCHGAHY